MISNLQLPNSEEFDVDTTLTLRKIFGPVKIYAQIYLQAPAE